MDIKKYVKILVKDFFAACGCLTCIAVIFLGIYSKETFGTSLLWQVILLSSAYTLFKSAFWNKHDLEERAQMFNFFICSFLADVMIIVLLCFFTPGGIYRVELFTAFIIAIIAVKAIVYPLMYMNACAQAKQINEKLNEYNGGKSQ